MEITRHNYEEYFLLYVDNELNASERKAVEVFVQQHPDLEEELVMLQQSVLRPDEKQVFIPKEYLMKDTAKQGLVNESNYEEYFVLYGDDELTNEQKDLVEQFVYKFPQYQVEFELIQQARLFPEPISFPDKQDLYRSEKDDNRVVPFAWWRMAAAAIVILTIGGLSLYLSDKDLTGEKNNLAVKIVTGKKKTVNTTPDVVKTGSETANTKPDNVITTPDNLNTTPKTVITTQQNVQTTAEKIRSEKKSADGSNIIMIPDVQPVNTQEMLVKNQGSEKTNVRLSVKPVEVAVVNSKPVPNSNISKTQISAPAAATVLAAATPNDIATVTASEDVIETQPSTHYVLNAPVNKTPLRGLFRKISRVVDKATTVDRDENGKGGVRIANFEIALK